MYRPDNSLLHISILRKSLKRQNHPRSNCSCNFERFCQCSGSWSGLHLRFGPFLSVQWLLEWVALAFSSIIASAVALGVDCTCIFGHYCECSGSWSGLHLHFREFLSVQWLLEWVALAYSGVFASAVSRWDHCGRRRSGTRSGGRQAERRPGGGGGGVAARGLMSGWRTRSGRRDGGA